MFDISEIRPKSSLGPVKAKKFSLCLGTANCWWVEIYSYVNPILGTGTGKPDTNTLHLMEQGLSREQRKLALLFALFNHFMKMPHVENDI